MATNPCKCGFFGDPKRECRCSPNELQRYRDRISGPLLDRIDIQVEVPALRSQDISSKTPGEFSAAIRERVTKAREVQRERFAQIGKVRRNSRMSAQLLKRHCELDEAAEGMMKMTMTELNFSARVPRPHPQSRPHHRRPRQLRKQ
jgi:magnesium chelatase family protein